MKETLKNQKGNDTMEKKITKRAMFTGVINFINSGEFGVENLTSEKAVEMLRHELELLERKNSSERKPTAQQIANDAIKIAILDCMEENRLYTVTEILKAVPECNEMSNQKVSSLMRQLKEENIVEKVVDKRKTYYQLAERV